MVSRLNYQPSSLLRFAQNRFWHSCYNQDQATIWTKGISGEHGPHVVHADKVKILGSKCLQNFILMRDTAEMPLFHMLPNRREFKAHRASKLFEDLEYDASHRSTPQ